MEMGMDFRLDTYPCPHRKGPCSLKLLCVPKGMDSCSGSCSVPHRSHLCSWTHLYAVQQSACLAGSRSVHDHMYAYTLSHHQEVLPNTNTGKSKQYTLHSAQHSSVHRTNSLWQAIHTYICTHHTKDNTACTYTSHVLPCTGGPYTYVRTCILYTSTYV